MWTVDEKRFEKCMQQFVETVLQKQNAYDYGTTEIAFDSGYLYEQGWHKRLTWSKAQDLLDTDHWTPALIGSGRIIKEVSLALDKMVDSRHQNILDWKNLDIMQDLFEKDPAAAEALIYRLILEKTLQPAENGSVDACAPQTIFREALNLWGPYYLIITALFYLKDRQNYLYVRPYLYRKRLQRMGIETDALGTCSWENYEEFLEIMRYIQLQLVTHLDDSAQLVDAHTFMWLMTELPEEEKKAVPEDGTSEAETMESARDPLADSRDILNCPPQESVVVTGPVENRRKVFYISKYEKDLKTREAVIRAHGYKCMACGFDFEKTYGSIGRNYIEIHDIHPMNSPEEERTIDAAAIQSDFVCLCSNCHKMVHRRRNGIMSVEELTQWVRYGVAFGIEDYS